MSTPARNASAKEDLFRAMREDNIYLFEKAIPTSRNRPSDANARFLNTTTDDQGLTALHLAAQEGTSSVSLSLVPALVYSCRGCTVLDYLEMGGS